MGYAPPPPKQGWPTWAIVLTVLGGCGCISFLGFAGCTGAVFFAGKKAMDEMQKEAKAEGKKFVVSDTKLTTENDLPVVVGTAKNTSVRSLSPTITFTLLDASGKEIGEASANNPDRVPAGGTWKFKAFPSEMGDLKGKPSSFKLKEVTAMDFYFGMDKSSGNAPGGKDTTAPRQK